MRVHEDKKLYNSDPRAVTGAGIFTFEQEQGVFFLFSFYREKVTVQSPYNQKGEI